MRKITMNDAMAIANIIESGCYVSVDDQYLSVEKFYDEYTVFSGENSDDPEYKVTGFKYSDDAARFFIKEMVENDKMG